MSTDDSPAGVPLTGVSLVIVPKEVYIERREGEQRISCDLWLRNSGTQALRINKIQVSAYDAGGVLAFRRYIDENGRPSGIASLPDRILPASGALDVFNPFYSFDEEMPLARMHYEVFFEKPGAKEPNLLNFLGKAEADVYPKLYVDKAPLTLPLRGKVYVFDGHDFYAHHRRQARIRDGQLLPNDVRYGYDFMLMNAVGDLYHGDRFDAKNWFSYGAAIYAPAAGTVVDAVNTVPENSYKDREVVSPPEADRMDPDALGNHVVIDHGDGEFSILLHMKTGSVRVKKGDVVKQGEQVGAVGFSGDTFVPHLHYQLMDGAVEAASKSLPSYFEKFERILGVKRKRVQLGQIDSGDIVESLAGR